MFVGGGLGLEVCVVIGLLIEFSSFPSFHYRLGALGLTFPSACRCKLLQTPVFLDSPFAKVLVQPLMAAGLDQSQSRLSWPEDMQGSDLDSRLDVRSTKQTGPRHSGLIWALSFFWEVLGPSALVEHELFYIIMNVEYDLYLRNNSWWSEGFVQAELLSLTD